MFRKRLVCRRDVFFLLKILSFGKKCDEVVQMKSRGIRKVIFCKILTYSERSESLLSPKVSLTTICDLHLLLRVLDRRGCFPSLRRSWCQFFCYFNIGTTEVEDSNWGGIEFVAGWGEGSNPFQDRRPVTSTLTTIKQKFLRFWRKTVLTIGNTVILLNWWNLLDRYYLTYVERKYAWCPKYPQRRHDLGSGWVHFTYSYIYQHLHMYTLTSFN